VSDTAGNPRVLRTKTTELEALGDDRYRLRARLTDVSSGGNHGAGTDAGVIHDFVLNGELAGPDLVVTALDVRADDHPYAACPDVLPLCQELIGSSLASGWRRTVLDQLSGTRGCTHVTTLLLGLGEVRTQAFFLRMNAEVPYTEDTRTDGSWTASGLRIAPSLAGACHALRRSGAVIAAGSQPPAAAQD
jgi:hypothetical protein